MQFVIGGGVTVIVSFTVGALCGWWLRGRGIKEEMQSMADEMGNDIWPGEGRS